MEQHQVTVRTLGCPNLGPSGPPGPRRRPPTAGPTLGMTNLPCTDYTAHAHGRDSALFDRRKVNKKGLPVKDLSLHVTELEKSRRKVPQKDNFLPLSPLLFSSLSRAREKVSADNPFLSCFLSSKIVESLPWHKRIFEPRVGQH